VGYRTGKFVRRHRAGVAAAALAALALLVGLGAALWQARLARAEAARAQIEATKANRIADFLKTMILEANPMARSAGQPLTLLEVVESGAETVEQSLADAPELQAQMMIFFGDLALGLDDLEQAEELIAKAFRIATTTAGVGGLVQVDAYGSLGQLRSRQRRWDEAEQLYVAGLDLLSRRPAGATEEATLRLEATLQSLFTQVLLDRGRLVEAIPRMERATEISRRLGGDGLVLAMNLYNLGTLHDRAGQLERAERALRESLAIHRALLDTSDPRLYYPTSGLADIQLALGALDEAYELQEQALAAARAGFGDRHALVAAALCDLAVVRREQGRLDEARAGFESAIRVAAEVGASRQVQLCWRHLAEATRLSGATAQARAEYLHARQAAAEFFGEDSTVTILVDARLALIAAEEGDASNAAASLESLVTRLDPEAPASDRSLALQLLGEVLALAGRRDEALAQLRAASALAERELGSERLLTARVDLDLGMLLLSSEEPDLREEGRARTTDAVARIERLGRGWLPEAARARGALAGRS
jgi:tetratricopeptide (TPR) repeat protein